MQGSSGETHYTFEFHNLHENNKVWMANDRTTTEGTNQHSKIGSKWDWSMEPSIAGKSIYQAEDFESNRGPTWTVSK